MVKKPGKFPEAALAQLPVNELVRLWRKVVQREHVLKPALLTVYHAAGNACRIGPDEPAGYDQHIHPRQYRRQYEPAG